MLSGCLRSAKYGFKRNGFWVIFIEYQALFGNIRSIDNDSGRVFPGANVNGAEWTSFLNASYAHLPFQKKIQIIQALPFSRTSGTEPMLGSGSLRKDKYYSSNSGAFQRHIYY